MERARLQPLLLLAAGVFAFVSLNLPWEGHSCGIVSTSFGGPSHPTAGLANLFSSCAYPRIDGWSAGGEVEALAATLLVFLAVAALIRPHLRDQVPLGQCALAVAYFSLGVLVQARLDARRSHEALGVHLHLGYGGYVGVAAGALALLGAFLLRRDEVLFRPPRSAWLSLGAAGGVLIAFLLPWSSTITFSSASSGNGQTTSHLGHFTTLGLADSSAVICAGVALRLLVVRWRDGAGSSLERLGLAAAAVVFAGAAFTVNDPTTRVYGAWIGLAVAVAALILALAERPRTSMPLLRWWDAGAGVALVLFITSLFLPWQRVCYPRNRDFAPFGLSGRCVSSNGWALETSVAALAGMALVAVALAPRLQRVARTELAIGFALLVATLGSLLATGSYGGVRLSFGYGATIGFVAAALLVGLALAHVRPSALDRTAVPTALPAITLGIAYVAAVVVPWWDVLPTSIWSIFAIGLARISWLTIAAAVLGLRLTCLWITRLQGAAARAAELVVLPLALDVLAGIDAVRSGIGQLAWNTALLGGLALALTAVGFVDRAGGVRAIEIPEILRIDRI